MAFNKSWKLEKTETFFIVFSIFLEIIFSTELWPSIYAFSLELSAGGAEAFFTYLKTGKSRVHAIDLKRSMHIESELKCWLSNKISSKIRSSSNKP